MSVSVNARISQMVDARAEPLIKKQSHMMEVVAMTKIFAAVTATLLLVGLMMTFSQLVVSDSRLGAERPSAAQCADARDRASYLMCAGRYDIAG